MLSKNKILYFTLVPLFILFLLSSYYRYMVQKDFLVSYEGDCDPHTQDCFLYCEDDECTEPFYYSIIERNAAEIFEKCGNDVTDCEAAQICPETVPICSITFCDPGIDGDDCETITSNDVGL